MRSGVDASREARDDHDPRRRQLATERGRHARAVARAGPRADDRDCRLLEQAKRSLAPHEEARRRIVNRAQADGNSGSPRAIQRKPRRARSARYAASSNRCTKAEKRAVRGASSRCDPLLCSEHRDCELAHAATGQLRRRTVGERLGEMLGRDVARARERGDRRGDTRDTRATAARERQPLDRPRQQLVGCRRSLRPPLAQSPARTEHPLADGGRTFARRPGQVGRARTRHRQEQVEAVEQRARELLAVALDALGRAEHWAAPSPRAPQGQRFIAATSWKRAGNTARPATRTTETTPSSSGWRRASSTGRWNSGSSSRKRTP